MAQTSEKISHTGRWFAALIASMAWLSLAMQFSVSHQLLNVQGFTLIEVMWRMLGYFTILTNVLLAVVMTRVAYNRWPGGGAASPPFLAACMMYIVCVGVVFHFLLAQLQNFSGLAWVADKGLHTATPTLMLIWWLVFAPKSALRIQHAVWWLGFPLAYCGYALLRGKVEGWYPYPFIDVATLGLPRVLLNCAALTSTFLLIGGIVVIATRLATRKSG